MSPASQGSLEVERYIGSCLISARTHNNSSNSSPGHHNHHQQQHHYKNKKVSNGEHGGSVHRANGRLPLLGCPHHGYAMPPGSMMMCDCARYGSAGHAGAGWAGMPLISMAANARRSRKPTAQLNVGPRNVAKHTSVEADANLRTPLSRLAIHTQGAPLILAGHYSARKNNNNNNNNNIHRGAGRQFNKAELPGRRCNDVPRDMRGGGSNNNTPNSDCLSVASDESSGHSENSLPRIIKPRKRRKKDRKPTASSPTGTGAETDPSAELPGIVTLKPYVPLCHELYDNHRGGRRREQPDVRQERSDTDDRASPSSEDDVHDPKLQPGDVDGDAVPLNTLFPYPCPPSTCQCRYCDPSGLIWDVDQHCYSPFLTPPSLDLSYPESSLVHIPLFLTPPPESKTFDFFNKDFKDSSSTVTDADHKEVVRRSWSEPGTLYSDNDDTRNLANDFGVIGGGRALDSGSRSSRVDAPRLMSTSSESSTQSSISPSLVVSTEIVTSLNGHRDIEIKFFSSSPNLVQDDVIGGCDSLDNSWLGVDGEVWGSSQQDLSVFGDDLNGNRMRSVWGKGSGCEETDCSGDSTWGTAWPMRQPVFADDASSKLPIEEVNQLCLQHLEE